MRVLLFILPLICYADFAIKINSIEEEITANNDKYPGFTFKAEKLQVDNNFLIIKWHEVESVSQIIALDINSRVNNKDLKVGNEIKINFDESRLNNLLEINDNNIDNKQSQNNNIQSTPNYIPQLFSPKENSKTKNQEPKEVICNSSIDIDNMIYAKSVNVNGECVNSEYPIKEDYIACSDYLDQENMQYNLSYKLYYDDVNIQYISQCKTKPVDVEYSECGYYHDYENGISYLRHQITYENKELLPCGNSEKTLKHEVDTNICLPKEIDNKLVNYHKDFIEDEEIIYISECYPADSYNIKFEKCGYDHNFESGITYIKKRQFYNDKNYLSDCQISKEQYLHKRDESVCPIKNFDDRKFSKIQYKIYIEDEEINYISDCIEDENQIPYILDVKYEWLEDESDVELEHSEQVDYVYENFVDLPYLDHENIRNIIHIDPFKDWSYQLIDIDRSNAGKVGGFCEPDKRNSKTVCFTPISSLNYKNNEFNYYIVTSLKVSSYPYCFNNKLETYKTLDGRIINKEIAEFSPKWEYNGVRICQESADVITCKGYNSASSPRFYYKCSPPICPILKTYQEVYHYQRADNSSLVEQGDNKLYICNSEGI